MSENKKFILGSGISGLCYSYYHPEYTIIGEELGGKLNKSFFENIIYFHATKETEKLLQDVKIPYKKKTQIIKYVKDGKCTQDITKYDKVQVIRKKLDDPDFMPRDLNLSTDDYYISIFEFSFKDLIDKISKRTNIITDKVIRITDKEIITEKTRYEYSNIVSTLPAYVFNKLYYKERNIEFKRKSVTFVLADKEPAVLKDENYDLCYILDDKYEYNRVSKKNNLILYEFTGEITKEAVKKHLPKNSKIKEYYIDKSGIIHTNKNNFPPKNILFTGRFSTWKHSDKQQDVLRESQWNYDIRNIFNRQGYFSSQIVDFNNLYSIRDKENLTKDFLLHMLEELGEVLNETNYTLHKKRKRVNIEKIKEELMDIQKYLLNLFLVWDVDAKEFVKLFDNKSDIVERRWDNK